MKLPSEPNETEHTDLVRAALHEAARYEPENDAPGDLVSGALARHHRSGQPCGRRRRPVPALAVACSLVLLAGVGLRLRSPQHIATVRPTSGPITALQSGPKAPLLDLSALPHIDISQALLPPIDMAKGLFAAGRSRPRHRIVRHHSFHRPRLLQAQNRPTPPQTNCSAGVWTTETVHCEIVTQTLTPVWVAHADPETQTVVLTPALFQLSLQPADDVDSPTPQVGAALIPVRFEQENHQP